jgi:hypothetical protein
MGDMSKDMPAPEGRSQAVSTDVADTVEGLMPQLMEIFAGGDEVVRFDPVGPQDAAAAEQETDYVNHVFMQKNPGFLILYSFIKDALLSKVGIAKVWWEEREEIERETYLDLTEEQFAIIAGDPDVEIVEHTEHGGQTTEDGLASAAATPSSAVRLPSSGLAAPLPSPGLLAAPGAGLGAQSPGAAPIQASAISSRGSAGAGFIPGSSPGPPLPTMSPSRRGGPPPRPASRA